MNINELNNMKRAPEMPLGRHEVTFKKIQYRKDDTGEVNGVFVHIEEYRSLFIPFFEENNFQLDFLLGQLDEYSYAEEEINKHAGAKIIATRYQNDIYTNTSFNPRGTEDSKAPAAKSVDKKAL